MKVFVAASPLLLGAVVLASSAPHRGPHVTSIGELAPCAFTPSSVPGDWVQRRLPLARRIVRVPSALAGTAGIFPWAGGVAMDSFNDPAGTEGLAVVTTPDSSFSGFDFGAPPLTKEVLRCRVAVTGLAGDWHFYDLSGNTRGIAPFAAEARLRLANGAEFVVGLAAASPATRVAMAAALSAGLASPAIGAPGT